MNFDHMNFLQEMESRVLAKHKEKAAILRYRINELTAKLHPENEKMLIKIHQKQIFELESYWNVYEKVKSRAHRLHSTNKEKLFKQILKEIYRMDLCLPVLSQRIEIEEHFNSSTRIVIIQGETGSGKSTQIPQYVADHPKFAGKRIICTQPRKIAAVSLANRVSFEYNGGNISPNIQEEEVGYNVGGDRRVGRNCRMEFITEGILLQRIANDSGDVFENVGCIIIDEAHERSVTCDILLGYFKKRDPRWKDIFFIVTSATIDLRLFRNYFKGDPCLKIEGRTFPVDVKYSPIKDNTDIRDAVAHCALEIHLKLGRQPGDILVFLPGQEDVIYAQTIFESELLKHGTSADLLQVRALVLYGRMEPDQQAKVFETLPVYQRKVVFSTDVAETSVTINGIVYVVDSGVKKEVFFDHVRNLSSLKVTTISKSSAIQRTGRCGRTQPGICYRMYSNEDFEKMEMNTAPEIHRKPISLAVLTLRGMKIDPVTFDWISAPSNNAIVAADEELRYLGALDMKNELTELGKLILIVQQDPKVVKMIYSGCKTGFGITAINIAAVMSVSNIVFWNGNDESTKLQAGKLRNEFSSQDGDVVTLFRLFEKWMTIRTQAELVQSESKTSAKDLFAFRRKIVSKWCSDNFINGKAMNLAFSTRKDLLSQFKHTAVWNKRDSREEIPTNLDICRLACSGYFLNAARFILSKKSNDASQYCSVHSGVIGKLGYKCAFSNSHNKTEELPTWIIYEKIFCPAFSTIFPITSFIDISWIEAECPEFHQLCIKKEVSLPTERIVKFISQECLRMFVGKRFENVESLETEWECGISGDLETGRLELYSTVLNKSIVEHLVENKIADIILDLANYVTEEEYLDGTRVVIGQGFEVREILFPQEYATLAIKNIPNYFSYFTLKKLLTQENENLGVLEVTEHGPFLNAVAKFCSKSDAKRCFERIANSKNGTQMKLEQRFGQRRQISQSLSTHLKLSWAMAISSGTANLDFHTAEEANSCIDNIANIFPNAKISRVHGDSEKSKQIINQNGQSKYLFPPVICVATYGSAGCRFRFDTNNIGLDEHSPLFIYKITVVNLPLNLDEQDIKEILRQYRLKSAKVNRGKSQTTSVELDAKEIEAKLSPLRKWRTNISTRDFLEVNVHRAGVYIYFNGSNGNSLAKEAYNKANFASLGLQCGQRHRLEIGYIHSVSINTQLLRFLEGEFNEFKLLAQQKEVHLQEIQPKNGSRFTMLKIRTNRQSNILWAQEHLEKITSCIKFTDDNIGLLFTWVGKLKMAIVTETGFVHSNNKSQDIWIYGNAKGCAKFKFRDFEVELKKND